MTNRAGRCMALAAASVLLAAGLARAEPTAAPPLRYGMVETTHMTLCMPPEQADVLSAQFASLLLSGGTAMDARSAELGRAINKRLREESAGTLASAAAGDAQSRAYLVSMLSDCLLAGIDVIPSRREQALAWLREDAAHGDPDASDTLAVLAALGTIPGGEAQVQRLLAARAEAPPPFPDATLTLATASPQARAAALQHMTLASALLRRTMRTFSTELRMSTSDKDDTLHVTYRPCPGLLEQRDPPRAAVSEPAPGIVRLRARLAELPRAGLDCAEPAVAAIALPLSYQAPSLVTQPY
ncbi:hypothetical protein [Xanthomonas sacchari]|uniref:hypothetical protein n=1 Tax=Xanthomonas sacchari TaxID=56458 RepID=UPI00225DE5B5|nr:hypothetical protein [Xanthomonas sacchari]MCW0425000.1 hypothetical protein [Xanthomonas sacchari]MCW0437479.1 hypothetical protein [Xanthomonas sacchari]